MAEAAKIARRSAKGKFTRKRSDFLNSVRDRNSIATIEKAYDQLEDAMKDLEGKHEQFTSFLNDEEFDAAENWMSELQTLYRDATNLKNEYMDNIQFDESNARATREREELENQQREQNEKLKENILIKRSGARTLFDAIFSNATHILETENAATSLMKKVLAQLEEAFIECKLRNEQYLELIGKEMMEQELLWISNVQVLYSQIFEIFETRISEKEESKLSETTLCNSNSPGTANNVHLEKIKRPHFEGDIREYPQFKRDFQTQVMPGLTKLTAPYTLRTCLDKEALAQVKSVDDDIEEMWARLDEKFGDPGKVTDVMINDIKRFKVIREGESKKFVEFVDMIEDSYRDLKRLGIEKEITTTSSVSTIESKLPPDHRKEWARLVSLRKSTVDKTDKFPSLLDFLLDQKRAIEYDASDLRSAGTPQVRGATHLSDGRPSPTAKYCLVHGNAKHSTYECRNYLAKPVQQRKDVVKDKLACFSCLKPGHRWVQCKKKKECGIDNCKVFHHRTLHENKRNTPTGEDDQEEEVSGTTNTCSRISSKTTCLLQIQRIKTHANWLNVMWDNASSLSFITNKTAKAQKLHGTTVQLSLVKVGAEKKDITTKKYTLPLIDLQGHQTLIEVYGIDQITSNIRKIKIDGILHIFDVPKKDIERPTGTIDVLIGYDYAGLHPEMQNRSGHLLLLKNRFGFCIGGTHPAIEENAECFKYNVAHVNHVRGIELSDFYKIENLGVECTPRCGGCKCGKCPPGSKNYTLKEEKELNLIENNLEYNSQENLWITTYPWIKDPHNLPDNKRAAYGRLMSTEQRLRKNPDHAKVYQQQIQDMIDRDVARKLNTEEITKYNGPVHYISHQAAQIIKENSYMDDIIESVDDTKLAKQLTEAIEELLIKGGFRIKEWIMSKDDTEENLTLTLRGDSNEPTEKVLGVVWNPRTDQLCFRVKFDLQMKSKRKRPPPQGIDITSSQDIKLTKRIVLSQVNRIYDPMGLATPFTIRAKGLMRSLWISENKSDWDDPIPDMLKKEWMNFFDDLPNMEQEVFERCIKPANARGDPILVIFSDGSEVAYGACAYARWNTTDNSYESRLIISKNRLSPVKKMSIDRVELCGAVLNKRLKTFIEKESRYKFTKFYHIVDSQIVYGMVQKESYGFNTFAATRIGEIQQATNKDDWYWVESKNNIADWITRGRKPAEIGLNSIWQTGPEFLRFPEHEWPICKPNYQKELPEQIKTVMLAEAKSEDSLEARIDINRYSNYTKLIRVTARVLSLYKRKPRPSLKNVTSPLTPEDIDRAERFWILRCQKLLTADMEKGRFKRLCPRTREDGIIVVGGRVEKWLEISYNKNDLILLPYEHRFARLYAEYIHQRGHHGVSSTVSKIRARFWITNIQRMVRSIKYNCVICKKIDKQLCQQKMGKLPEERLKPSPPWHYTGIDLFGPFKIRDEVKRRTYGKCYGVIFNCMCTRAVHLDLAPDYSTETFLLVLRRFVSLRGYPAKLYSDNGPQLVAADKELKDITKNWNWDELLEFGVTEGLQWEFSPADAPWYNGTSEALIRSVKRGLNIAIGDNIMTFSELQTACFEVGNLINERPIGKHPTDTDDGVYLSPNDLLLGRSTSRVPSGPFRETTNPRHRFEFVQNIVKSFWRKWTRDYFPSLLIESKWHTAHRDVKVGDVVLIQDSNLVRGNWKLGKVITAKPSKDGILPFCMCKSVAFPLLFSYY